MTRIRLTFLSAAALTALALALPLWGFRLSAPQYPGESLHLRVSRAGMAGDVGEIATLQRYVGVRFPERIPELSWIAPVVGSLALLLALAGLTGEGAVGRALRLSSMALLLLFLAVSAALLQKRLWELGHDRDPDAPLEAIRDFTPPAVGPVRVGNFTVWSYPHAGAVALVLAAGLVIAGSRARARRVVEAEA